MIHPVESLPSQILKVEGKTIPGPLYNQLYAPLTRTNFLSHDSGFLTRKS